MNLGELINLIVSGLQLRRAGLTVLFPLFFIQTNLNGQLTKGAVYDFEVGDVFQTKNSGAIPGYLLTVDTIAEKIVLVDTIKYVIHRIEGSFGPPPLPSFNYITDTLVITDLNATAMHYTYLSCLTPIDDTLYAECSDSTFVLMANYDDSCFEPPWWISKLSAGLGGPYYSVVDYSGDTEYDYELIYSNTSMWGPCGNYQDPFVGIEEMILPKEKTLLKIIDMTGQEVTPSPNKILILIYSDGSREKFFILE